MAEHGGKRSGAGRKKGAKTRKTRAVAEKATAEGITPLEVMLDAMRRHHQEKRYDEAAAIAKDAAPYMHPRLSAVDMSGSLETRVRREIVEEIVSVADRPDGGETASGTSGVQKK